MRRTRRKSSAHGAFAILPCLSLAGALGCSSSSSKASTTTGSGSPDGSAMDGSLTDDAADGSAIETDGGEEGGSSCAEDASTEDGSTEDASTPPVSFTADVLPILSRSCGYVSGPTCHGSPADSQLGLYLANPPGDDAGLGVAATIVAEIVGVASKEDPSMNLVTAGSPEQSYLQHKIDGCLGGLSCATVSGVSPNCGVQMPYLLQALDSSDSETIERWIAQGAQDN